MDSQGEQVPKHVLEGFVSKYKEKQQPLNQDHDIAHRNAGYIENFRLIEDSSTPGEWSLVADVYCDDSDLKVALGGFSISYLEIIKEQHSQPEFLIYLPYPHYNDETTVRAVSRGVNVNVGKWVKKSADPATIALVGATAVFILKPVWEDFYKTQIAPKIYAYFSNKYAEYKSRNIYPELLQTIEFNGNHVQVILIPIRGSEDECVTVDYLDSAMKVAHNFLYSDSKSNEVAKIHLYFHSKNDGFKIHRIEFINGEVLHHA